MRVSLLASVLVGIGSLTAQANDAHTSKSPPKGPPWLLDFAAARDVAMREKKPIFVYSTKTYCPHCVVMEKGLLADAALAKDYGDVVWMYLFQDFSHSDTDRAAERVAIRFGISSWPQHFLVDPFTLQKVADTGRSLDTFRAAVARAKVKPGAPTPSVAEFAAADALAQQLEKGGDLGKAKANLAHADRVVAFRAVQAIAAKDAKALLPETARLLAMPNDQIRGQMCDMLAEHGDLEARDALHDLARDPVGSENPNVMRMRAVKALARCGDASSIAVIEPFATSGEYRNGLTMTAVRAVAAIGKRVAKAKPVAVAALAKAYPAVVASGDDKEARMCEQLAKQVHDTLQELSGKQREFPGRYDDAARQKLMQAW
jgi:hypothetical protein